MIEQTLLSRLHALKYLDAMGGDEMGDEMAVDAVDALDLLSRYEFDKAPALVDEDPPT